jgi:plasmid maintenance system antidote protein VapI
MRWNWLIATEALMASKTLKAVHPGDILLHEFMEPLKLSSYKLAKVLGV